MNYSEKTATALECVVKSMCKRIKEDLDDNRINYESVGLFKLIEQPILEQFFDPYFEKLGQIEKKSKALLDVQVSPIKLPTSPSHEQTVCVEASIVDKFKGVLDALLVKCYAELEDKKVKNYKSIICVIKAAAKQFGREVNLIKFCSSCLINYYKSEEAKEEGIFSLEDYDEKRLDPFGKPVAACKPKKSDWFSVPCPQPHLLVWAKQDSWPFWPAKLLGVNPEGKTVSVIYFDSYYSENPDLPVKNVCFLTEEYPWPKKLWKLKKKQRHRYRDLIQGSNNLNAHLAALYQEFGQDSLKVFWHKSKVIPFDGKTTHLPILDKRMGNTRYERDEDFNPEEEEDLDDDEAVFKEEDEDDLQDNKLEDADEAFVSEEVSSSETTRRTRSQGPATLHDMVIFKRMDRGTRKAKLKCKLSFDECQENTLKSGDSTETRDMERVTDEEVEFEKQYQHFFRCKEVTAVPAKFIARLEKDIKMDVFVMMTKMPKNIIPLIHKKTIASENFLKEEVKDKLEADDESTDIESMKEDNDDSVEDPLPQDVDENETLISDITDRSNFSDEFMMNVNKEIEELSQSFPELPSSSFSCITSPSYSIDSGLPPSTREFDVPHPVAGPLTQSNQDSSATAQSIPSSTRSPQSKVASEVGTRKCLRKKRSKNDYSDDKITIDNWEQHAKRAFQAIREEHQKRHVFKQKMERLLEEEVMKVILEEFEEEIKVAKRITVCSQCYINTPDKDFSPGSVIGLDGKRTIVLFCSQKCQSEWFAMIERSKKVKEELERKKLKDNQQDNLFDLQRSSLRDCSINRDDSQSNVSGHHSSPASSSSSPSQQELPRVPSVTLKRVVRGNGSEFVAVTCPRKKSK